MDKLLMRCVLALAGGIPVLIVSGILLSIWIDPASVAEGRWVKLAAMMIIIEFVLLQSGAFMAVGPAVWKKRKQQLAWFTGMCLFYGLFLAGIALWSEGGAWVVWMLVGVFLSRLLTLVVLRDKCATMLMLMCSALGLVILMVSLLLTMIEWPEFGISDTVAWQAFDYQDDAMSRNPERFIAAGVFYFAIMGLIEFWAGWRLPDWEDEAVEESWRALSK
jgi:hypothetical protein